MKSVTKKINNELTKKELKEKLKDSQLQEEKEEHHRYELIFNKYQTIKDTAFKFRKAEDHMQWQKDMLRCYTDSFLVDDSIAGKRVYVICNDHQFKMKNQKKQRGNLKATFKIYDENDNILDIHHIKILKVHQARIHQIIDTHMLLLELALSGYFADEENESEEESLLEKIEKVTGNHESVQAARDFIKEIKQLREEAKIKMLNNEKDNKENNKENNEENNEEDYSLS